jgi:hypothetical protein
MGNVGNIWRAGFGGQNLGQGQIFWPDRAELHKRQHSAIVRDPFIGTVGPTSTDPKKRSGRHTLAVPSSEPLTRSGGPRLSGQQLLTKLSCSAIFFTCSPVTASQARTLLSGLADTMRSPSDVQCSSSTAFLWPAALTRLAVKHCCQSTLQTMIFCLNSTLSLQCTCTLDGAMFAVMADGLWLMAYGLWLNNILFERWLHTAE